MLLPVGWSWCMPSRNRYAVTILQKGGFQTKTASEWLFIKWPSGWHFQNCYKGNRGDWNTWLSRGRRRVYSEGKAPERHIIFFANHRWAAALDQLDRNLSEGWRGGGPPYSEYLVCSCCCFKIPHPSGSSCCWFVHILGCDLAHRLLSCFTDANATGAHPPCGSPPRAAPLTLF